MLGARDRYPLPGRLYRHGLQFDFMFSSCRYRPSERELRAFLKLLREEVSASGTLERMLYESRKPGCDRYTMLQLRLIVRS
jgi:hypothetical protein